jgi:hypothetical protein
MAPCSRVAGYQHFRGTRYHPYSMFIKCEMGELCLTLCVTFQFWLKSGKNNGHFTWLTRVSALITSVNSLNIYQSEKCLEHKLRRKTEPALYAQQNSSATQTVCERTRRKCCTVRTTASYLAEMIIIDMKHNFWSHDNPDHVLAKPVCYKYSTALRDLHVKTKFPWFLPGIENQSHCNHSHIVYLGPLL